MNDRCSWLKFLNIRKKEFRWCFLVLGWATTACTSTLQNQRQFFLEWMMPPPVISELKSSTLMIQSENGNLLVLVGKNTLFSVNTLMDETLWMLLKKKTGKNVSHLVLTGTYWEQVNGLGMLDTPIEVFLSKQTYDSLQSEQPQLWEAIKHHHFHQVHENTQLFFEKQRIALYRLKTAQSDGNMALYLPDEQILYTGMLYLEKEHAFFATHNGSLKEWIDSLDQLTKLNPKMIIPGRGKVSRKKNEMVLFREYLNAVLEHASEAHVKHLSVNDMIHQSNQPLINQRENIPFLTNKHQFLTSVYQQIQTASTHGK